VCACSTTQRVSTTGAPRPVPSRAAALNGITDLFELPERVLVANIKSQIKRIKTNAVRTERNKAVKSELKTWIRKFREAAAAGDADAAKDALKVASTKLDKAVTKGVIHQNQAANKKSAMAKKAASL
jgi:small subunit ribosomal protein S20